MIEYVTFSSEAIRGFPLGDPHERTFPIYLPPGYDAKRSDPYPVAFFLAGYSGKGATYLTDDSVFGVALPTRWDRAIQEKRLMPFIGVFPDATTKYGCSQYVNSPVQGNFTDYICSELPAFVDERYHTHASRDFRAVVGHSSGGFGALVCGMLRPDAFSIICSSAGDSFFDFSFLKGTNLTLVEIQKAGSVEKFLKNFLENPNPRSLPGAQFEAMLTLGMAPCFAPNPNNPPLYGDIFFDIETGEILPEVWKRYQAWDPVHMLERYTENLRKLHYIRLECGAQDEHGLQWGHRQISKRLKKYDINHEIEEYPGGHGGHHWRFENRMIRITERMY